MEDVDPVLLVRVPVPVVTLPAEPVVPIILLSEELTLRLLVVFVFLFSEFITIPPGSANPRISFRLHISIMVIGIPAFFL